MIPRLGVNIDHVATLRQTRGESYPNVAKAAKTVIDAGADQITMHLREDRRHIQDQDMFNIHDITKSHGIPLNFEMGANEDIIGVALRVRPEWICLVPEKREEKTTEGGLSLLENRNFEKIKNTIERLYSGIPGLKISLFVESDLATLGRCVELGVDAVEIHTGEYAKDFINSKNINFHLKSYLNAYEYLKETNVGFHAGHGLTQESLLPLVNQGKFVEYNIGHSIVSESLFIGLESSVKNFKNVIMTEKK